MNHTQWWRETMAKLQTDPEYIREARIIDRKIRNHARWVLLTRWLRPRGHGEGNDGQSA